MSDLEDSASAAGSARQAGGGATVGETALGVRRMFDRLAPRYDLFNDVLSAGVHHGWRRRAVDALNPGPGTRYMDLCAGTLELARAIADRAPAAVVVAADFSLPMLAAGLEKGRGLAARPVAADALALPFAGGVFRGLAIAFGLRNLADRAAGLAEMRRVLEPGGRLVVLEFTTPPGRAFRAVYHAYFHHVLPRAGAWIAGDSRTSRYLPDSVSRFPEAPDLAIELETAGFGEVRWTYLTGGIAALHTGVRG